MSNPYFKLHSERSKATKPQRIKQNQTFIISYLQKRYKLGTREDTSRSKHPVKETKFLDLMTETTKKILLLRPERSRH